MNRTFKVLLFTVIILIGVGGLAVYWTFYRTLPNYSATIEMPELQAPVNIQWDTYGVPHIYAGNKHDLYMSVGYVHAQDRLWQMTVSQMAAEGRFAEFLGEDLVPIDRLQRTIGFWRIAKKMEEQLPDSTRRILQAYADGVNRYVELHRKELPIQFSLADMSPIRWTPTHSLALARLMAWELNIAWKTELTYNLLFQKLSADQLQTLFPNPRVTQHLFQPAAADTGLSAALTPVLKIHNLYEKIRNIEGINTGSNAWAVDASKSNTGKPLLAGDPHLPLSIPGNWYEVHLHLNGRNLSGTTIPGAPSVVLGQNNVLAWSFTNMMLDGTDFFEEQLHPSDSSRYMLDTLAGEPIYEELTIQREVIKVKNSNDHTITRRVSRHGPIISDVYPRQNKTDKTISMQWTGLEPGRELQALQGMGWATGLQDFRKAAEKFKNPAQNIIYADTAGNIALLTAAQVPIRLGNPIAVRPGWQPEFDWQGYINHSELPAIINPESGWVANANNPVVEDFPNYLSVYWQPNSRYERIRQYLSDNDNLSSQAFQIMQNDTYSAYAQSVMNIILPILNNSENTTFTTAINYFQNWDYSYARSETAATIFDVFLLRLAENTLQDELGVKTYQNFITYSALPTRILLNMLENNNSFFDDISTEKRETRAQIIRKSMEQALSFLTDEFGNESSEWQWQNLHHLTLTPAFFGRAAEDSSAPGSLKMIVDNVLSKGPYNAPGTNTSINNGEYLWARPYDMVIGPSIRRIVDLQDTRRSLSIMPGGQSGNPLSDYYNDQTQSWLNGQYKFIIQDSTLFTNYKQMQFVPEK